MKIPSAFFRRLVFAGLGLGLTVPALAQNVLLAEHKGKPVPVRSASKGLAVIEENGRRVTADGTKFALKKVDEFLPAFVTVHDLSLPIPKVEPKTEKAGGNTNPILEFQAGFEAAYALKDVFIVIEFNFSDDQKTFFIYEVGQLEPRRRKDLKLNVPTGRPLGTGTFQLHVFSAGLEVFHSQQPRLFRESQLDAMVEKRVKTMTDANPQPLFGPMPVYPAKFAKSKVKGQATLTFRVGPKGEVLDPAASSATDPAFGEAAVTALRDWRFLPKVVAGRSVETEVQMPMAFDPPL